MQVLRGVARPDSAPGSSRIAVAIAAMLTVLCAVGVAAFAGLLPTSERVAASMTASPLIDMQIEEYAKPVLRAKDKLR